MDFLILAHPDDTGAMAAGALLRRRYGKEAVGVISAEALAMAPEWRHSLIAQEGSSRLRIDSQIGLAGGMELPGGEIKVVFNRLRQAVAPHFQAASVADQEYASVELSALWVSWLAGLQAAGVRVINPPLRGSLQPGYSRLEWLKLAFQAGLAVTRTVVNTAGPVAGLPMPDLRLLAAGCRLMVLESLAAIEPADLWPGIQRLQDLSGCPLLELGFRVGEQEGKPAILLETVDIFPILAETEARQVVVEMLSALFAEAAR